MTDKLNQTYDMNMKARGCIEKFKVYLNKDENELEHLTSVNVVKLIDK